MGLTDEEICAILFGEELSLEDDLHEEPDLVDNDARLVLTEEHSSDIEETYDSEVAVEPQTTTATKTNYNRKVLTKNKTFHDIDSALDETHYEAVSPPNNLPSKIPVSTEKKEPK